jgi:hypothetical protein
MPLKFLPTNPFSKTNHFGVSLCATSIRGIMAARNGAVATHAEIPLSAPLSDTNPDMGKILSQAVKQLTEVGKFDLTYAAVSIPEKFAYSREHILPRIELEEINEAIGWQIEKIFPFPKNEIYWDWKMISQTKEECRVLVTAVQKGFLDQLKAGFEQAGVNTISFESSASALTRLAHNPAGKPMIIVEVEITGTTATLVIGGIASLTTTTIISHTTDPGIAWQELINSLQNLLEHAKQIPNLPSLPEIIITGEKATDQMASLIGNYLKIGASVLKVNGISPAFHLAYAASISAIEPPSSALTINLLPTTLQEYYRAQVENAAAKATLRLLGLLLSLASAFALAGLVVVVITGINISAKIDKEKAKPVPIGPQGLNLALIQTQSSRFVSLFPKKTTPELPLSILLKTIPEGITVTSVAIDPLGGQYTLSGIAKSRTEILALKQAIDETKQFTKVVLPLSALDNTVDYNFTLSFKVKK